MTLHTRLYLAIDQGGHASRATLVDEHGNLIATAHAPVSTRHPAADHVEHDPEEMVRSLFIVINEALRGAGRDSLVTAGLATQRSSVVCWDRHDGTALSPILSWQDRRTSAWLTQYQHHADDIRRCTGLPLSPHYGASKLRWCLDHLPAVQRAHRQGSLACGPLASFLVQRITREATLCTDPANASRTLLWNLEEGDWDASLLNLFAIPSGILPPCVPTRHDFGHLAHGDRQIPLAIVTGDQSAALFAAGIQNHGQVMINLGTGAFLQQAMRQRPPPSRLLASLAYQDSEERIYALEGTVNGAGSALAWAATHLQMEIDTITLNLEEWLRNGNNPPLFLNGVAGLGTPYWNPRFNSRFIGEGTAADRCVAVAESIVFLLAVNLEEMAAVTGPTQEIFISGGLSRLDGLCQRLADLSGLRITRPADQEATVRGLLNLLLENKEQADGGKETCKTFLPKPNPALAARYRQWQAALDSDLAKN